MAAAASPRQEAGGFRRETRTLGRRLCSLDCSRVAPVIPTGAPGSIVPLQKSLARSGGIPRHGPLPCCFKAFSPNRQWQQLDISKGTVLSTDSLQSPLYQARCTEDDGNRDSAREEFPIAAPPGMVRWDPSTPRHRLLAGSRALWRSGRDDSPNGFSKNDQDLCPGAP
jgi:hypothetical protein